MPVVVHIFYVALTFTVMSRIESVMAAIELDRDKTMFLVGLLVEGRRRFHPVALQV